MTHTANTFRIALIHATPLSMNPARKAFQEIWPEAETINMLDDALSRDRDSGRSSNANIKQRITALGAYALQTGAAGILYTCSAFGTEIDSVKENLSIPVLKPNEAMFQEALEIGGRIGMLATFKPSIPSMEHEFNALAEQQGRKSRIDSLFVDKAMAALGRGDLKTHNQIIGEASAAFTGYQVVMLAQFSVSQAAEHVRHKLGCRVLTSPQSAVKKLKPLIANETEPS